MKQIFVSVLIVFIGFLTPASFLHADENPPPALNLHNLISQAIEKNPEVLAAKAEWLASKKRIMASWALPDPTGEYDIMGPMVETMTGPQKNHFAIEQEVPFPAKLWEKRKAAKAEADAANARFLALERDITAKLSKLYYELYFIDASVDTLAEIKDLLKKFEGVTQARYSNISGSQRDVAKAQAEFSMNLEKLYMLQQQRESIAAQINALLDQDPMTQIGKATLPAKPELKNDLVELVNLAVKNRQAIKEAEAMVSKTHYAKRLAQLAYLPDINVGFEYTQVGKDAAGNDGENTWMFPLKVNLPIWQNRIIPEIQEAQKLEEAQKAKLLAVKNQTFFEVKDAYYRFESASKIADLYEVAIVPQSKLALTADQAGYEAAKTDFLNLLDSERVYLNAKLSQIRFYTEALKAYIDLCWATGLDLEKSLKEQAT
ncbi:MAG TPA: TolC family protein [Candidatus Omnitrophota bacterium]|nr:TolC family protein [Candidatus Omnitrophota bacterium]HRY85660.1 TolC family protein [Candidatus Omnitrophota bacterium]